MEGSWEIDLLSSYGNSNISGYGNIQEKNVAVVGDQISSLGPNIMSNENQMVQQREAGLLGDVVVGHGSREKNVGCRLEIMSSLGLNSTTSNENQRAAQQLEAGLICDNNMVLQEKNASYEMLSLGPNTTLQKLNVLGSIRGVDAANNIILPHGGQNENEGHVFVQKRKGKEIIDHENANEGRRVVLQKRKGKEIINHDNENEGRHVVHHKRKGKEIIITDLEIVGKEKKKRKQKRKNTSRQPVDMGTRVKIEQERRRKEALLYADLRAMHPNLHPKAPKFRVIEETMSSIESLKQTFQSLEKQKLETRLGLFTNSSTVEPLIDQPSQISSPSTNKEPPAGLLSSMNNSNTVSSAGTSAFNNTFKTWTSSNFTLSMCGISVVISICSLKRHGLFTTICLILKNHNLDIVSAEIFSTHAKTMYMIHVRGYVPPESMEEFPYEKLYKKAVAQIKFCLDL